MMAIMILIEILLFKNNSSTKYTAINLAFEIISNFHSFLSIENRLTYPLEKRQIDLLVSTLAFSATDHVDLES
jgi:hypothetical protein